MKKKNIAWQPYGDYLERSRIRLFMDRHGIKSVGELRKRSADSPEWFWPAALKDLGVEWFTPYHTLYDDSEGMPWTKWFLGGKLNIVHNCLDRHIRDGRGDKVALYFELDDGSSREITYRKLYELVNALAKSMRKAGIKKGDRVAMCMPISIEAVAVMFAAMKIGAVCMQPPARIPASEISFYIQQAQAKMLFMNDGYPRAGKIHDLTETHATVMEEVSSPLRVVVLERVRNGLAQREGCISWEEFLHLGETKKRIRAVACDSEDPALILYSSGTTGKSKTIIHVQGGILAQVAKEVGYAFDCREDDVFYWFTNIGWMMAPWEIIGALFFGASVVLFEGTHMYPNSHRMFELIEKYRISIFGFTPTAMRGLAELQEDFSRRDRSSLRILGSTGEVLDPKTWLWYFKTFGESRCPIMNISGGTELIGCLLSPLPVDPQKPGTLVGPGLGMAMNVFDENGKPIRKKSGYLVCTKPFPSMTRGFLGEQDRYLDTYFYKWPNVWVHGDLAEVDKDGFWFLRGRVDDLIVSGGVKLDPAKIEAALMNFENGSYHVKVKEAAAIGAPDPIKGEKVVCFVVLDGEVSVLIHSDLRGKLQEQVGREYDKFARPEEIYFVSALPTNLAAKVPRGLLRKAYKGEDLGDLSKITNAHVLEEIKRIQKTEEGR